VVDEQHRFGVRQRAALDARAGGEESPAPHVLHMTATPIPRTLALARYGDLDVTVLRELPRGRQPIETFVCSGEPSASAPTSGSARSCAPAARRSSSARWSRSPRLLQAGAPRPPSSSGCAKGELRASAGAAARPDAPAREAGGDGRVRVGKADVLVATTVIEVGIDVPNATVMLVEDAERYGISQLHQLRGRIGRGEHASLCLLFGNPKGSCGCRRSRVTRRLRAGRDRPRAARRGRAGRHPPVGLAQFRSPSCRATPSCSSGRALAARDLRDDPELKRPSTRCWPTRWRAYGAEALAPIRA
jgi:ATP-dependent DNA helicase RecG